MLACCLIDYITGPESRFRQEISELFFDKEASNSG